MAVQAELKLISEKVLHQAAHPSLLAYCPSMELLALGSTDQQVLIYRLNGQRVYGATQKGSSLKIERISWKPSGQLLAVAWSDGVVRLVGPESSKTVHQISTGVQEATGITCLGWASNSTGKRNAGAGQLKGTPLWNDVVEERLGEGEDRASLDLPRDLSLIDVESSMPKLSVLPAGSTSEDIFSSRMSLDGLFRAFDPKDNDAVDILVVGTKDGRVHLSIYDSFVIGSFPSPLPASRMGESSSQIILHASHKHYSTHSLLVNSTSLSKPELYFVPMDLRFVSASSEYLSLLASRSTALQNLLRYIHQVQILMTAEWQSTQDLPNKFLRSINESLEEKNGCDIVQAMYHSVATGHTFPVVREWLVDELAERGHKRWDKAVTSGLENLRKLVHEDMLPALERCNLILSRLAGIVKYQGSSDTMGFSSHQISLAMDTVACLNLVSTRIQTYVVDELDLFAEFSAWLRHEINRLASDTSSSVSDDMLEKEATIDHSKVLLYIQTTMTTSRMSLFFQEVTTEDYKNDWESAEQRLPMFELLDKQLRKHEERLPCMKALPKVELLCKHLARQATIVFQQIAEAEKRNVLFGQPTVLGSRSKDGPVAMRVCPEDHTYCRTYIALISAEQSNLIRIFSIQMQIENGISSRISMMETAINFEDMDIKDMAFLDDCSLIVLTLSNEGRPSLLTIPYRVNDGVLSYDLSTTPAVKVHAQIIDEILSECGSYSFPEGGFFIPDKLEVSERNKKRAQSNSTRLCILAKDRLHYKVFSIPKAVSGQAVVDEDIPMA